jgi:hypothetical protein
MKPAYQKQKGHKNFVLTPQVTFEVTSYQLFVSLTYPLKITKVSPPCLPTCPSPTPRQHLTPHRAQQVLQALQALRVQAAPEAKAPEAAARDQQSSLPSARGQGPAARRGARGV